MLKFKDCQVTVSGTPITANSVSLVDEASVSPVTVVGYRGPAGSSPSSPKRGTINIEYKVEANQEPNFYLAKAIREYVLTDFPVEVAIGGITGSGYLSSYSISIIPNDIARASVTYDVYHDFQGNLSQQNPSLVTGYNWQNNSGLAHYWTTYAKTIDGTATGSIFQGEYSFNVRWNPIYKIGSSVPVQVNMSSAEETFSFLSEYNVKVVDSGRNFEDLFTDVEMIEINNQASQWTTTNSSSLKLYPASGKVVGHRTEFGENSPIIGNTNIIKFY